MTEPLIHPAKPAKPPKPPKAAKPEKAALCESCAGIQRNWRKAPGHAELVQTASVKEERDGRQVNVTGYRCDRCGTLWRYENDKANLHAGWSVFRR